MQNSNYWTNTMQPQRQEAPYPPYDPAQYLASATPANYGQAWPQQAQYVNTYQTTTGAVPYYNQYTTTQNPSGYTGRTLPVQYNYSGQQMYLSPDSGGPSMSDFNSRSPSSKDNESVSPAMYVNHINRSQLPSFIWFWTAFISLVFLFPFPSICSAQSSPDGNSYSR